ncbi:hypothetical protein L484_008073 [Morus notabilis]|uniref:Uncharacterized protein n=1 Tax=Morus notabilis TaxID=981085 RepID=W9RB52_9ROSA|nr:hypothetical protein L484_008073 [Morus notabilis]
MIELSGKIQSIDSDPLPPHKGKDSCAMISSCSDETKDSDFNEEIRTWLCDSKPPEAIWESSGNCEKAFWRTYTVPLHPGMPMLPPMDGKMT